MIREELAWAAGFIDGEGTVGIYTHRRKYRKRDYPLPLIRARNSDRSTLERLKQLLGGYIRKVYDAGKETNFGIHRKDYYEWAPYERDLLEIALALAPHLTSEKKAKAFEIIKFFTREEVKARRGHWSHPKRPALSDRLAVS